MAEHSGLRDVAIRAARAAGKRLEADPGDLDIEFKRRFDYTTQVDRESERIIIDTIRRSYPDHKFFAEESLRHSAGGYRWFIDPLDGTTNYIHGFPVYSVSIACEYDGDIFLGVVYDPSRDELFVAEKGAGAVLNNRPIRVSEVRDPAFGLLTTGFPFRFKDKIELYQTSFARLFERFSGIRRTGSAALDLCYLACGRCEGFWEIGLSPWDVAAGFLIVAEAGGRISDFHCGENPLWSGNVIASNGHLHPVLQRIIEEVFR
jgi:myo-inositol-1(or 4)-monophosphatase